MAKEDIRRYSLAELKQMTKRGDYKRTRKDAPEIELDEAFWKNARVVMPGEHRKKLVSLRLDNEVFDWFKMQGRGHLSRMSAILRAYMESHREQRP